MSKQRHTSTAIIMDRCCAVKTTIPSKIKVTVHVPEDLHERVRQQKINHIYDILKPDTSR